MKPAKKKNYQSPPRLGTSGNLTNDQMKRNQIEGGKAVPKNVTSPEKVIVHTSRMKIIFIHTFLQCDELGGLLGADGTLYGG